MENETCPALKALEEMLFSSMVFENFKHNCLSNPEPTQYFEDFFDSFSTSVIGRLTKEMDAVNLAEYPGLKSLTVLIPELNIMGEMSEHILHHLKEVKLKYKTLIFNGKN